MSKILIACRKQGQDLDHSQFPGPEALKEPGKKHGDVKVIRNNKKSEVYQVSRLSEENNVYVLHYIFVCLSSGMVHHKTGSW